MSAKIAAYLNNTGDRDKVMAIVQFLPMALAGPVRDAGAESLGQSLGSLSAMADGYRAITRLGLLFNALSKPTLKALAQPQGDVVLERVDQLSHFFHVFFCVFENSAVLANHGVYPRTLNRLGGCAVTCWFHTLLLGLIGEVYVLTQKNISSAEVKQHLIKTLKIACFFVFSMSCVPKGGPQLLENVSGPLVPLHKALQFIAPRHLELSDAVRGTLGLVASICDFY